ncbi:O-antigen ligase family protein [bacterium]|nr:O-antigen ligase family protein [bacterium]
MTDQYIYLGIMAVVIVSIFIIAKEPVKILLGLTVVTSAWQGGLWLAYFDNDMLLATILYAVFFVYIGFRDRQLPMRGRVVPHILIPALLILIGMVLSAQGARNLSAARGGIFIAFERILVFYTIAFAVRTPKDLKYIFVALIISVLFQSVMAILQFRFMSFRIGVIDSTQSYQQWRGNGTFFHANSLGMFYVMMVPIIIRFLLMVYRSNKKRIKYLLITTLILAGGGLFATQNRGGWLGLTAGLMLVFGFELMTNKTRINKSLQRLIPLVLIMVALFTVKYGSLFYDRMFGTEINDQYDQRRMLQDQAIRLIHDYPLFGVGYFNYRRHIAFEFVHNLYLLIASECGYFGLVAFVFFLIGWFVEIVKGAKSKNLVVRNLNYGILSGFLGFVIASIPGPDYQVIRQVGDHIWLLAGMTVAINRIAVRYDTTQLERTIQRRQLKEPEAIKLRQYLNKQWSSILG